MTECQEAGLVLNQALCNTNVRATNDSLARPSKIRHAVKPLSRLACLSRSQNAAISQAHADSSAALNQNLLHVGL